ncbi:MAG: aldehyde dehydrogenase family protein [Gammaproteobacteria bacterium]|jgi:aldehyde dehydrogenase (NAD+)|nr:aldehyde dehydrogenase family protein [Gammaproteobacteria bacterium]
MTVLQELNLQSINSGTFSAALGWHAIDEQRLLDSVNPATGQVIAQVSTCSANDYERVIQSSREVFEKWRTVPAPKRGDIVRQIANALRQHKDALGSLVAMEMGKIKQEGDGEVQEMIDIADLAVGQSRMLYGKTMHSERTQHRMYEQWHPLGVVGVISAFNFPVAVWSWNAFIAAVCGNTVIWKPSSKVPLCAIAVQHICNTVLEEAGHPGVFSLLVPQEKTTAQAFVEDERIPLMSFTGSSQVGHYVAETVAKRMGKTILECSGNNAIIVDETANLDLAVPAVVFGAVGTAGQRCTTTRRLFVHDSIYQDLVTRLVHGYQQVRIGDPLDSNVLMGPLIDQQAVQDFIHAVERAQQQGGKVLTGGKVLNQAGQFVEPTIIEMDTQTDVVKEETFAPILYVMRYSTMDKAIQAHNDVPQGLSSAIFTNQVQHAEQFLSSTGSDCGIANVNIGTSGAEIGGAFGGEKQTGGGREAGSDSWKAYMRRQTNTINWGNELPLAQGIKFDL